MLATIRAIGGLLGLIVSLVFLARQTKAVSEQVKKANTWSEVTALDVSVVGLREIYFKMLDHPGVRPYFYEGLAVPAAGDARRDSVLLIAESLVDTLEGDLMSSARIPGYEYYPNWRTYCRTTLSNSPALRSVVVEHPDFWPKLRRLV